MNWSVGIGMYRKLGPIYAVPEVRRVVDWGKVNEPLPLPTSAMNVTFVGSEEGGDRSQKAGFRTEGADTVSGIGIQMKW